MSTYPPDGSMPLDQVPGMDGFPSPASLSGAPDIEQQQPEPPPLSASFLQFSDVERQRLLDRINMDFSNAINDHRARMQKAALYYNMWRTPIGGPDGVIGKPNFKVPLIEWMIEAKLANIIDSLFGDDAEIIADPVGKTDQENATKIGVYMTWLFFSAMKAKSPLITFLFRCITFGRAFCMIPYCKQTYEDAVGQEQVEYEGPEFIPLYPDDFIVPAEQVKSLHEFSFVIRRYRETPDDLLRGEDAGRYEPDSITKIENWARIFKAAYSSEGRNLGADNKPVQTVNDNIEGVTYGGQSARDTVEVREWYGRWRMLKSSQPITDLNSLDTTGNLSTQPDNQSSNGQSDAGLDDWEKRDIRETEIVVRYIPEINHIISIQRLVDLYPNMKDRRPFDEMPLMDTGEYWCKGYPEMLIDTAYELTVNNNLRTEAGEMTVAPPLGVKKGSGYQFKQGRYGPRQVIELDNPASDARTLDFRMDLQYTSIQEQALLSYAERLTGISDQTLGRAIDRPNAPRTARGQLALINKGDVRLNLDNVTLREHLARILQRIWLIDSTYSEDSVFFRVTEEKANGLFAANRGLGEMTAAERGGRYDFRIKFATSSMSKAAEQEKATILFQSSLATPLVQTNPQAQWNLLDQFFKAMGRADFKSIIPEPPPMDAPMNPMEEWTRILQGEPVHVHWGDVDDDHITQHRADIEEQLNSRQPDMSAVKKMGGHIVEHIQQKNAKIQFAMQAAAKQAAIGQVAAQYGIDPQMLAQEYESATGGGMQGGPQGPGGPMGGGQPPQGGGGMPGMQPYQPSPGSMGSGGMPMNGLEKGLPGMS